MTLRISDKIPKGRLSYEHKVISQNEENHTAGNNCHLILNLRTFFSPLPSFSGNKIRNEYGCYDNLLHMTIFSQAEVVCGFFLIFIVTQYFLKVMK